jgi:hypothetical protein
MGVSADGAAVKISVVAAAISAFVGDCPGSSELNHLISQMLQQSLLLMLEEERGQQMG